MTMSPPRPPSPPLGPPRGTNFSRRNARHPFPPSPALTVITTSSMNTANVSGGACGEKAWRTLALRGDDVDELAQPPAIAEFNRARHGGKQRVVFAQTDIFAWLVARSALPDYDGAAGHKLTRKYLDAKALRIRIAAVLGTA